MKREDLYLILGFGLSIAACASMIIPALSIALAVAGITFSAISLKHERKNIARAGLFVGLLALLGDLVYLYVVMFR